MQKFRYFISLIALLFLFSCAPTPQYIDKPIANPTIGQVQSEVTKLTLDCNHGKKKACDELPAKKQKLQKLLDDYNRGSK